ncbi:MAG: AI-2E family transporter [Micrococcaceae bacterium]
MMKDQEDTPEVQVELKKPVNVSNNSQLVPLGMRVASEWSWRIIIITAAMALIFWVLSQLTIVIIPILVALLLAALLNPAVNKFVTWKIPRGISVFLSLVGLTTVVSALVALVGNQFSAGYPQLRDKAFEGFEEVRVWISDLLLHRMNISIADLDQYVDQAVNQVRGYSGTIASSTFHIGNAVGHVVAGFVLTIFILIFFLLDGDKIWKWIIGLLPFDARVDANDAGRAGWKTVVSYVRVQLFVAFVDGLGVAIVAMLLHIPLAIPLGVLVFLGSFVPIIGSLISGMVAVLVALVAQGPTTALLMLLGVILVQQFESHVLQPFVIGSSLSLHPLAVVLVVAAGTYLAGITGALFSVPLAAAINVMGKTIAAKYKDPENPDHFVKAEQEPAFNRENVENFFSNMSSRFSSFLPNSKNSQPKENINNEEPLPKLPLAEVKDNERK